MKKRLKIICSFFLFLSSSIFSFICCTVRALGVVVLVGARISSIAKLAALLTCWDSQAFFYTFIYICTYS